MQVKLDGNTSRLARANISLMQWSSACVIGPRGPQERMAIMHRADYIAAIQHQIQIYCYELGDRDTKFPECSRLALVNIM